MERLIIKTLYHVPTFHKHVCVYGNSSVLYHLTIQGGAGGLCATLNKAIKVGAAAAGQKTRVEHGQRCSAVEFSVLAVAHSIDSVRSHACRTFVRWRACRSLSDRSSGSWSVACRASPRAGRGVSPILSQIHSAPWCAILIVPASECSFVLLLLLPFFRLLLRLSCGDKGHRYWVR